MAKIVKLKEENDFDDKVLKTYQCTSCGREYPRQKDYFFHSRSVFYKSNNYFLPYCRDCTENMLVQYRDQGLSEEDAIKRIALHADWYYSEDIMEAARKRSFKQGISMFIAYANMSNLRVYYGKTYDTYLDEVKAKADAVTLEVYKNISQGDDEYRGLKPETVEFFGFGYKPEDYIWLESQYNDWISRHECKTKAQEEIFKNLSLIQLQIQNINEDGKNGKGYDKLISSYNALMTSANIKPVQTQDNALTDHNTFGTLIQKWENEKPIPEPDPEFEDVDGIREYISTWFFGHLCKMVGVKNKYSAKYEKAIEEYNVKPPEYIEEDEINIDDMLNAIKNSDDEDDVQQE